MAFDIAQPAIDATELAARCGVDVHTVRRWYRVGVKGRRLEFGRVGGRVLFNIATVNQWIAGNQPQQPVMRARRVNRRNAGELRSLGLVA